MSANEKAALLMMKGILADLEPEEKVRVDHYIGVLRKMREEGGDAATLALSYIALEMAAEDE